MSQSIPAVTGNIVYNHFSHPCPYRVHLDLLGDRGERAVAGPTGRYLMERGNRHEERVFEKIRQDHPDDWADCSGNHDAPDREVEFERRIDMTFESMRSGVKYIFHGFVRADHEWSRCRAPFLELPSSDLGFRGETDILERVDVPSAAFGDHSYIVGDVKSSQHARFAQKMQVTFYSWILEGMQGRMPDQGYIITGSGSREEFSIDETIWMLRHFVEEEVFELLNPEHVFYHFEPSCSSCHWRNHCEKRANTEDDLSLIPSCRRSEKRALAQAGIMNRKQLMGENDETLRDIGRTHGNRMDGFRDLQRRASAQEFGRPILRQHPQASAAVRQGVPLPLRAPDLFQHRGPYLLLASVNDHYFGDEATIAALLRRREELDGSKVADRPPTFLPEQNPNARTALIQVLDNLDESNKLLESRREHILPVFCDGRLTHRLRGLGEDVAGESPALAGRIERFLADAIVLSDIVDRTWFLPSSPWDLDSVAAAITRSADEKHRAEPFVRNVPFNDETVEALTEIAGKYGLDCAALLDGVDDLRPLVVREWRESGGELWANLLQQELAEDLRCGEWILAHLINM